MTIKYNRWLRSYVGHQRLLQLRIGGYICDEQGRIMLCRRADVMLWDVPGGTMELGETPAQGLVREVLQETGLLVEAERLIGVYSGPDFEWTYPNGDQAQIVSVFFRARIIEGQLKPSGHENVKIDFFAPKQLPALLPRTVRMLQDARDEQTAAFFE
jgi:ADP-ribose pyrophosphatase YjhB (NUDIX family)